MKAFLSDLDNTLIYSYKKIGKHQVICIEKKEGKELSYMTKGAYGLLQEVSEKIEFIPVTTRSIEQYQRVHLLKEEWPPFALTSNGGTLLYKNRLDEKWQKETNQFVDDVMEQLEKAIQILKQDKNVIFQIRLVDSIFVYTKSSDVTYSMDVLKKALDLNQVFIDCNGEKLYVFPKHLTKGFAVKRLKEYLGIDFCIGAGDSLFDAPMLEMCDIGYVPQNSELSRILSKEKHIQISAYSDLYFGDFVLESVMSEIRRG